MASMIKKRLNAQTRKTILKKGEMTKRNLRLPVRASCRDVPER